MPVSDNENDIIFKHPILVDIREISKIERISIKHADFDSGSIIVTIDGEDTSFEGVMRSLRFVDLLEKMEIQAVDFETGEITVRWHPEGVNKIYSRINITKSEIELLSKGRKIDAIKAVRARTNMGLADAKVVVEDAAAELKRRGLLR